MRWIGLFMFISGGVLAYLSIIALRAAFVAAGYKKTGKVGVSSFDMKAIIVCLLFGLSAFAADTNDIQIITRTYKIMPEDSLATVETFTRGGQTNLVRNTHTKDGVVVLRSQSFYHDGTEVGLYMSGLENGKYTAFNSMPGTPYYFYVGFDSSNKPHSAHITATNFVTLDWFLCTNGVFYPADSSIIREFNARLPKDFPPH